MSISRLIKGLINNKSTHSGFDKLRLEMDDLKIIMAKHILNTRNCTDFSESNLKVFSQWGDDGIIQYLLERIDLDNQEKTFIEFGVENYEEATTKFLLVNNNWSGLVMDSSRNNIAQIKNAPIYWKYDLTAIHSFVTVENINKILSDAKISGTIGLLHIDIDGNEYWVFKAIEIIDPIIVILEYNSLWGLDRSITVPYKPDFDRTKEHYSNLYAGASLKALCSIANGKGYKFIGCNNGGNNAYFVKSNRMEALQEVSIEQGYVKSKFREARNKNGELTFLPSEESLILLKGLPVYNIETQKLEEL